MKARQSKSVRAWLDKQVGPEKLELAKLLQEHAVIVRGGPEHAQRLMDALIVRALAASCFRECLLCRSSVDRLVLWSTGVEAGRRVRSQSTLIPKRCVYCVARKDYSLPMLAETKLGMAGRNRSPLRTNSCPAPRCGL